MSYQLRRFLLFGKVTSTQTHSGSIVTRVEKQTKSGVFLCRSEVENICSSTEPRFNQSRLKGILRGTDDR